MMFHSFSNMKLREWNNTKKVKLVQYIFNLKTAHSLLLSKFIWPLLYIVYTFSVTSQFNREAWSSYDARGSLLYHSSMEKCDRTEKLLWSTIFSVISQFNRVKYDCIYQIFSVKYKMQYIFDMKYCQRHNGSRLLSL